MSLAIALSTLLACRPVEEKPHDTMTSFDTVESVPGVETAESGDCGLRISEVVTSNHGCLEDADGDTSDWIEVFNLSAEAVDLAGHGLTDFESLPFQWVFPSMTIQPGAYVVVFASGKDPGPAGELHTDFQLSASGDDITLTRPDGQVCDRLVVPPLGEDVSYGIAQESALTTLVTDGATALASFGADSPGWTEPAFDDSSWQIVTMGIGFDGGAAKAPTENLSLFRPTTQSSDGYGYTGEQGVDGELSTFSHTGDADLAPWWQVDLGAQSTISSIDIFNRRDCCPERLYNLTVDLRDADGTVTWTSGVLNPVAEGGIPTSPGSSIGLVLDPPVTGSAVRVSKEAINGAGSSEWLSLAEVVVNGAVGSTYAGLFETDVGDAMRGIAASAFLRIEVPGGVPGNRLTLGVCSDDAFAAWFDGLPVASARMGEGVATEAHDAHADETFALDASLLDADGAILAVQGLNLSASDTDFLLGVDLVVEEVRSLEPAFFETPTPGAPNGLGVAGFVAEPVADPPRGFHEAAFTTLVTCETPGATLVYTLDGTVPTETHGTVVPAPSADETPLAEIDVSTTTILRAMASKDGWASSSVATHTFLFLEDVIRQPAEPEGLPVVWDAADQAAVQANYEMDPEIVDDPVYHDDLVEGLRAIPTLSVVTDPANLWDDTSGIYVNTLARGDASERPVSIEYILPDGSTGFQEDCGLRIHGYGWRYHSSTLKHAFRLEFREEYGSSKLEWPLFPDAPVERFDSIVLRAQGSRSWLDFRDPAQACYIRDAFARDTARDMGKVDGHATYVHLYLNGLYWGLYMPVERPEAGFGEEYLGGSDDEYDAINRRTTTNEAVNGDLEAYDTLLGLADQDLSTPAGYAAVQAMLDIDDLIDYMLIHQYTVNRDGPCCFEHNNMRGVRRRVEGEKFRFFVWDMEYSVWDATDDTNIDIDVAGAISHVYARLRDNADFRARYAERAHANLTGDGALTPAQAAARWETRADEIRLAIVAESARWGDTYREPPYTRDVEWDEEQRRIVEDFFPWRTDEMIRQLRAGGLY